MTKTKKPEWEVRLDAAWDYLKSQEYKITPITAKALKIASGHPGGPIDDMAKRLNLSPDKKKK